MPLQPYVFPSSPSLHVKIVQEYLKCIAELDFDRLSSLVTDDFTLAMSPLNLGIPDKTIAEELAILKGLESVLDGKSLSFTIYDINDGPRKTWVHARVDPIGLEIVYCFQFGEGHDADKIASLRDFVDSKMYTEVNHPEPSSN